MPAPFSLWRIELAHPALVHFPISFLFGAAVCILLSVFFRSKKVRVRLERLISFQLFVGSLAAWLAVWSGEQAHEVVNRVICDPSMTHAHSDWGWRTAYLATFAFLLLLLRTRFHPRFRTLAIRSSKLCVLATVGMMIYGAHLGVSLVYLQAAGGHQPDAECTEFSE